MTAGPVVVRVLGLCFGLLTILVQYSKPPYLETFSVPIIRVARWKNMIFDHFDICPHESLLVLQISTESDEFFSNISQIAYETFCSGDFWFSVSFDCSAPSKIDEFDSGWIIRSATSRQRRKLINMASRHIDRLRQGQRKRKVYIIWVLGALPRA